MAKTHKLMVKTHLITGLKYLCYTRSEGVTYDNYKGSGVAWTKHLKKFGDTIATELLFETEDYELFKQEAIRRSIEFNVVESTEWANLKLEEGDGGNTVSNKRWITDGSTDKYANKDLPVPAGWRYGRSKCVFNDPHKQSELAKRQTYEQRCEIIRKCWDGGKMDNRDNSKCGCKGDLNPAKRPEVRAKMSTAAQANAEATGARVKKLWADGKMPIQYGRVISEETRAKLRANAGVKHHTEEAKAKISASLLKRQSTIK